VCDSETRKNFATLKESLMDIDSNFDNDYNSVNTLQKKLKTKESEIKSKKKVTFHCADDNSSNEETFDYEYEDGNLANEETIDDDLEDGNALNEESLDDECEDENMSDEEHFSNDHEEKFDYDHKKEKPSGENGSNSELDEDLSEDYYKTNKKPKSLKEDIYGRLRKPDGSIVVMISLIYFRVNFLFLIY